MKNHARRVLLTPVREYKDGRWGFDEYWTTGKQRLVRRKGKAEAEQAAIDLQMLIARGRPDLAEIGAGELAEFRQWKIAQATSPAFGAVVSEFLAAKQNGNLDAGYVRNMGYQLALFSELAKRPIASVTGAELLAIIMREPIGLRAQNNILDALKAVYRFARDHGRLPYGERTAVDGLKRHRIRPALDISIYTPAELAAILVHIQPRFLPAVAIGAFAGIRPQEIRPVPSSRKQPLMWEDFHWRDSYIRVRAVTSKTGRARHVPLLPALKAWLAPWRRARGPISPVDWKTDLARIEQEHGVQRRRDGLRHSFGTYRHALRKRISELAEEMGNSESIIRTHYVRPVPERMAKAWFALRPKRAGNVIDLPQKVLGKY